MRYQLRASQVEPMTKGETRRLRNSGYVPVSVQHRGQPTLHLKEETRPLQDFIHQHGESALIELIVEPENTSHTVMVHDVQRDPLTQKVIHVTYQRIELTDVITTHVAIHCKGEPEAVKRGRAIAQHPIEEVEIQCNQIYLPSHFDVDISNMSSGDVLRVSDIAHDSHVTIVTPADTVIVSLKPIVISTTAEGEESVSRTEDTADEVTE